MTLDARSLVATRPIVLAPMAGGPSTPALAVAVAEAGGLPFLAGGYLTARKLRDDIGAFENQTAEPFGVNLFIPDHGSTECDLQTYLCYRQRVLETTDSDEALLPENPIWTDDAFDDKLDVVIASRASFVSFTFGHPAMTVINRIHAAGKFAVLYAMSRRGIDAIAASHADVIGIQGPHAGGHRSTAVGVDDDSEEPLLTLIEHAVAVSDKPVFAGGGVKDAADVRALLKAGATAVQVGTLFLLAAEAGTKKTHRRALRELTDRNTVITRAFTGRPARAIENRFTDTLSEYAPSLYPQLHFLTSELRKDADENHDAETLNLWAGTGFRNATSEPAAKIMERLNP